MYRDGVRNADAPLCQLQRKRSALGSADEEINFRKCVEQLRFVSLDHASNSNESLARAVGFVAARLDQSVDRFLFRGIDEAAGVDDDDFRVGEIGCVLSAIACQLAEVALAV